MKMRNVILIGLVFGVGACAPPVPWSKMDFTNFHTRFVEYSASMDELERLNSPSARTSVIDINTNFNKEISVQIVREGQLTCNHSFDSNHRIVYRTILNDLYERFWSPRYSRWGRMIDTRVEYTRDELDIMTKIENEINTECREIS